MLVTNVNGSGRWGAPAGYDAWLDYWEKQTRSCANSCSALGCTCTTSQDLVGAHVQKTNSTDSRYYIVPLCRACNQRVGSFNVSAELVPTPSNL